MSLAPLFDAHCHLADSRLSKEAKDILIKLSDIQCQQVVVNGTSPKDWQEVIDYCAEHRMALPAIGLHPWQVNAAPQNWQSEFLKALDAGVRIIGEIGLDQWVDGHDIEAQQTAFRWQLSQAADRNLPVSIHCLKALEPMMQTLRSIELPQRGIHLHALNVPVTAVARLIEQGTYFSFNTGQLQPNAKHSYELIRAISDERILVETDAPDFLPPEHYRPFNLDESSLNHPANLLTSYQAIAEIRGVSFESFRKQVENNFKRYFLNQ